MTDRIRRIFNDRAKHICVCAVALAGLLFLLLLTAASASSPAPGRTLSSFDRNWKTVTGLSLDMNRFYTGRSTGATGRIEAYNRLPYSIGAGDSLNFCSCFTNFDVVIDGRIVYTYIPHNMPGGTVTDCTYHHIPLTPSMRGTLIRIIAQNNSASSRMRFRSISIGAPSVYTEAAVIAHGPTALAALLILMAGFLGLMNDLSQKYLGYRYSRTALHISGLLGGIWLLIVSSVPVALLPDAAELFTVLRYLSLLALPWPFLRFLTSILPHKNRSWNIALLLLEAASIAASVILTSANTLEWNECLFFFYIMLIYIAIVFVELMIASLVDAAREHEKVAIDWIIFVGATAAFACIIIDALTFIYTSSASKAPLSAWAGLFLLACTIADSEIEAKKYWANTGVLLNERDKAYIDPLTGLLNRTAYERDSDDLRDHFSRDTLSGNSYLDSHFDLLIAYFDINNFKHVNDTLGHDVGDKVIQAAAGLLQKAFGKYGKVYRIGGDEFAATITGDDLDRTCGKALHSLRMMEDDWNASSNLGITLRIAAGSAKLSETESGTIHEVLKNADNDMYIHKAEMKKADPSQVRGA